MLVACTYCWLIWITKARNAFQNGVAHLIRWIMKIILPKKSLIRFYRRHVEAKKVQDLLFGDLEYGHDITIAKDLVFHTCCCYLALLVAITTCIISSIIGWSNVMSWLYDNGLGTIMALILWGVVVFFALKLTKTSRYPNLYLSYFRKFKMKDEVWLKKWKIYTFLLFIGSFVAFIMCLCVLVLCDKLNRNII